LFGLTEYSGWLTFSFAAMLFLFSPVVGNLSDRFGRRPVLLVSMLALGCDYLITGLAPTLGRLFVGRLLSGMAGTSYTTANAYIADLTPASLYCRNHCRPRIAGNSIGDAPTRSARSKRLRACRMPLR
jgi:DHA1 family tetracycline resistance protein-like MFS transporter